MIAHYKVNLKRCMGISPVREIIYLTIVFAMEKIAGNNQLFCTPML